ncbi:aspartate aminotransferase family protein [Rhodococcus sp. IEGM 1379]|uniref:aspartate aminotransferase family protein n=1 Tax=Rhodococcus sp. IEGM 1379 TaxID=3047086 RepID=UPI0024B72415|nr:aspartate aminotransferase family protein [Rhodococcus sp. IEGM 1379]MDI9917233.1 aspartate aminotransferase family protein [Rhodococcus sp. IEGM 1379]
MAAPAISTAQRTYELDRAHVFHSWSAQKSLQPMVVERTDGCYLWDGDGKEYLDFSSQLVYTNVGHQHPKVVAAIQEQAAKLCTIAPAHANEARSEAARLIAEISPEGMERVFFTSGGADANEHAIRMARLHTGRYKVLSAYRSYHGATAETINLSGDHRRWPNDYGNSGAVRFHGPFLYRSEFRSETQEQECERALEHLETLIRFEGPAAFAALIVESVPGTSGIMPPPPGYMAGVRDICDRYGIVMICDEVMSGFGRTGAWMAIDHYDAIPDLITFAKGVNSGYVPLGGVIIGEKIYNSFAERPYPGGLTYSGHPLACAAAVATITTMHEESIVENAEFIGRTSLGPGLRALAERHPSVGDVRGLGVFWALDLVTDRETREPLSPYGGTNAAIGQTMAAAREAGLLVFNNYHRIHVVPPCTVTPTQVDAAMAMLDTALDVADSYYDGPR